MASSARRIGAVSLHLGLGALAFATAGLLVTSLAPVLLPPALDPVPRAVFLLVLDAITHSCLAPVVETGGLRSPSLAPGPLQSGNAVATAIATQELRPNRA